MVERYDQTFRRGDSVTFVVRHKPFIDLSIPPSANDYRPASCMNVAIFNADTEEALLHTCTMLPVPNRPGWYYYRYQIPINVEEGLYTAIITSITTIDGKDYTNRNVQEFRVVDDGIQ